MRLQDRKHEDWRQITNLILYTIHTHSILHTQYHLRAICFLLLILFYRFSWYFFLVSFQHKLWIWCVLLDFRCCYAFFFFFYSLLLYTHTHISNILHITLFSNEFDRLKRSYFWVVRRAVCYFFFVPLLLLLIPFFFSFCRHFARVYSILLVSKIYFNTVYLVVSFWLISFPPIYIWHSKRSSEIARFPMTDGILYI